MLRVESVQIKHVNSSPQPLSISGVVFTVQERKVLSCNFPLLNQITINAFWHLARFISEWLCWLLKTGLLCPKLTFIHCPTTWKSR